MSASGRLLAAIRPLRFAFLATKSLWHPARRIVTVCESAGKGHRPLFRQGPDGGLERADASALVSAREERAAAKALDRVVQSGARTVEEVRREILAARG